MIVGITGHAGTGKDLLADILVRECRFVKIAMADRMKRFCAEALGFSRQQLWGPSELRNEIDERYGKSTRDALQPLGTEWGRGYYQDIWVDRVLSDASQVLERRDLEYTPWYGLVRHEGYGGFAFGPYQGVVIPDVRFRNELEAIRKAGGKCVKITREGSGLSGSAAQHASETDQDSWPDEEFDLVIRNDGTPEELAEKIRGIL